VFLNQVDDDTDRLAAAYRLQQIFAVMGIQSAWGSLLDEPKIAVILEAAGNSSRFGSNKLLHVMDDGRPMAASILEAARSVDAYKKILVTQYDEVAAMAPDFDVVMNDRPDLGISRSMQLGLKVAGDADAYMFCVCDQPGLTKATLERLIEAYKKGTAGIVSLAWQGKMCNPKIFSSRYKEELMCLSGDTGGRQILASHKDDILLVEAESEEEVKDIDRL
jgi:CTP:molybdopterin cytidylyltransferase MocA